ncbi:MAG: NAD(P)-dependent oxidoreductase [Ancalomicrobiaceae bacterium]|nr:NAD(P)-dependent oxidoreductase [Ancalomicrobiaceae bacterium]
MSGELRVGWAGIGKMGAPMSRRVLDQGFGLSVFEPVADNREAIVAAGASLAPSLDALAATADVVIATIPNDAVLRALVFGPGGLSEVLRPGQIFVEMSTVSPDMSAEVNSALAPKGIAYLRAPVSGSTATAAAGKLSVMVSGPEAAFRTVEPVLSCFSARRFYLGAGEEARYLKLVLNALVGATSALLGEALTLGLKGNLSLEDMLSVICESAVASPLIAYKRDMLVSGNFDPAFSVAQMMKDFDLILRAARQDHVPMFHASLVRQQYEAAYADGLADRDFFVLFEQYRRLAGVMPAEVHEIQGPDAV